MTGPETLFCQYIANWNARDFAGIADSFTEPAMFVLATGPIALPDRASLVDLLTTVFERLEAADFSHSTVGSVAVSNLSEGIALVDAVAVDRLRADGSLIETIDSHYVMLNTTDGWRITTVVASAPRQRGQH